MPGRVPIRNGKFSNAPDFTNQGVTGITGSGVFRSFSYLYTGSTSRTLQNSDLWNAVEVTGNCLITIPDNLGANVGDEIIIVNPAGFTSFTTSGVVYLIGTSTISPAERPARLIYLGNVAGYSSQTWLLSGFTISLTQTTPTDCCFNNLSPVYTLGDFSIYSVVYATSDATSLYTSSNIGNVVVVGSTSYTITSGAATETPCQNVDFASPYTFYSSGGDILTFYSYVSVDIYNDAAMQNLPLKTTNSYNVYLCDTTNAVVGTYYRSYDMYGASSPICFVNGIVTSFSPCP